MCISVKLRWKFKLFDVKTAYLYSEINENVYVTLPPGFEKEYDENTVLKLNKSMYGLPQSGRNWYNKFKKTLLNIGFKQLISENCIFIRKIDNEFTAVIIYVDDFTVIYNNDKAYNVIIKLLNRSFELVETSDKNVFLGIKIDRLKNRIGLSQTEYIEKLLIKYNMNDCNPVGIPIVSGEDK